MRLGNYEIVRVLGRGGMGEVYMDRDEQLDHEMALKVVMPERAAVPDTRERFLREARLACRLLHPSMKWANRREMLSKRLKSGTNWRPC